jgi:quinol monooxygenase YgiN
MTGVRPHLVLHLQFDCREPTGHDLTMYLRQAVPFYQSLRGVNVRLLRSLDRPGRFVEIIEYADEEAFLADKNRVSHDEQMQSFLAQWRELLTEPAAVEHFADITAEIASEAGDA